MARGRFVYLTGADGTGKSTHAARLVERLRADGVRVCPRPLWLRFPFLLSIPLLAYARRRGLSRSEARAGVRYGVWAFGPSWVLRTGLPWTLWVDAALASLVRVRGPLLCGRTIVCERFVLDMVVDLALGCDDPGFAERLPGRLFRRLLPEGSRVVILDLDPAATIRRRPSLAADDQLEPRLALYRALAATTRVPLVTTAGEIDQVADALWEALGLP